MLTFFFMCDCSSWSSHNCDAFWKILVRQEAPLVSGELLIAEKKADKPLPIHLVHT